MKMMNIYKKGVMGVMSLMGVMGVMGLASCTDYLDKEERSIIDASQPYLNFRNFQGFVEELYTAMPIMTGHQYHSAWNFGEDDYWEPQESRQLPNAIDQGNYWGWNECFYSYFKEKQGGMNTGTPERMINDVSTKGYLYGLCWFGIRKANIGIANLDKLVDATQEEKNLIAGQLYFFRAWNHFMLMQYWGGLPYIDVVLDANSVFNLPRLSYQATAEKAAEDFQKAADLLPIDWDQTAAGKATLGKNAVRINKVMALAYKGKDLLWAGSPMMNQESTGNATYNADFCKRAADTFAEALKICEETGRYELADWDHYQEIFYTYKQNKLNGLKEVLFWENMATCHIGVWRWNLVNDWRPPLINNSGIKCYPAANYTDYFGMANGLPIPDITKPDAASGYNPEYPYKDRDPRFYYNFIYDAVKTVLDGSKILKDGLPDERKQYASLYEGGLYRTDTPSKCVFTGYMNKKFTSQYMNDFDDYKEGTVLVMPLLRLADVYLMYAESAAAGYGSATASASGYSLSAVGAIDKVRARAGVAGVNSKFLGSVDDFMSEVRRERAVELSFEGHRFTDLRRWLLLDKAPYNKKTAVYFDRAADQSDKDRYANPKENHVLNLREVVLVERKYSLPKHNWFPFPQKDVQMYPEFAQNPGW
jgi:hypothetical protein